MMRKALIVFIAIAAALVTSPVTAQTIQSRIDDSIVLENEYIAIIVNAREEDTGRFSVNTTGGDPERTGDENKPLIFGTERAPGPWTSYTTVRVDGRNYVFGGPTGKRAGRSGPFTEVVQPPHIVDGEAIRTVARVGDIVITQHLSFAAGITTGRLDTARIHYEATNTGNRTQSVGMRIVLDTLLGRNDGAPFQASGHAVTSDTAFTGESIPDFFQAFDSLADPRVVSQGTLRAFDTTVPDEVYFSNWGSLADGLWNFDFVPGREFARAGEEFELDSAVALFWHEQPLAPGESREFVTYYGLGGITIAPGHLSIGITSPARIDGSHTDFVTFEVRAYIENTGDWIARDTVVRLENPDPLRIVDGVQELFLGDLAPRESRQVTWRLALPASSAGEFTYRVAVHSSNADSNRVERTISVTAPAHLSARFVGLDRLRVVDDRWQPVPFELEAHITNTGQLDAHGVQATLSAFGFQVARGSGDDTRTIGTVAAGETVVARWHLVPTGTVGNLPVSLQLDGRDARIDSALPTHFVAVPQLDAGVRIAIGEERLPRWSYEVGDLFHVEVDAINVRSLYAAALELHFDPAVLQVLGGTAGVGRGRVFVDVDPVTGTRTEAERPAVLVDNERGIVRIAGNRTPLGPLAQANDSLVTVRFRAVGPGRSTLKLQFVDDHPYLHPDAQPAFTVDREGYAIDVAVEDGLVVVSE